MNRLQHSDAGELRAQHISKTSIFAYVEGGLDRVFFDRLLEKICGEDITFEVRAAKEAEGRLGGKPGVMSLFRKFNDSNSLFQDRFGKKTIQLFFVDKDIDERNGSYIHSEHLIYTKTYDLEGHLLTYGDLFRAVSDATLITKDQSISFVKDKVLFFKNVAMACKDWLALCILSHLQGINIGCNYNMNPPLSFASIEDIKINIDLNDLSDRVFAALNLSREEFDVKISNINQAIEIEITTGNYFNLIKGKWYEDIFQKLSAKILNIPDKNTSNIGERVLQALVSQVPAGDQCACSDYFIRSISTVLQKLEPRLQ